MPTVTAVIAAYLLGSVPFALVVSRLFGVGDIRKAGSGNLGATNVWRVAGFKAALWVFIGDIGKGVAAVLLGRYCLAAYGSWMLPAELLPVVCGAAAVAGHVFPVYLGFRGGKGVNTALGAMLVLLPVETLISFGVFVLVVLLFRYVSLGSVTAALSFFVVVAVERFVLKTEIAAFYVYLAAAVALLIVVTHRQNIRRLLSGTESRFSLSSRLKREGDNG
ncbi:MAG: glycerol-3-phosphate 1-O-acyltransferase PlsY [Candidatus Zixiibacteriota bacterium]|nr:MAG: glycerol-3-phosphate 1-O-acyltransferase PlsY [candidate division Zixibacteria bacterium]